MASVRVALPRDTTLLQSDHFVEAVKLQTDLVCQLCRCVVFEPTQCPKKCRAFCKGCLRQAVRVQGACPGCADGHPLRVEDLRPAPFAAELLRHMQEWTVRCPHAWRHGSGDDDDCEWVGRFGDRAKHLREAHDASSPSYPLALVPCPHAGCAVLVVRQRLDEHQRSCEHRAVACTACGTRLVLQECTQPGRAPLASPVTLTLAPGGVANPEMSKRDRRKSTFFSWLLNFFLAVALTSTGVGVGGLLVVAVAWLTQDFALVRANPLPRSVLI